MSSAGTSDIRQGQHGQPSFDFHLFLSKLKHRSADPIAKYLKSFLSEFTKRSFSDPSKVINDFMVFIAAKMNSIDIFKDDMDNAMEGKLVSSYKSGARANCQGMEKLIMNRLYSYTFSPLPDEAERDKILAQKCALFGWVEEKHLDIPISSLNSNFLSLAKEELCKINSYRAPRDKMICILNTSKVIFGLLSNLNQDQSADMFIPLLIYTIIKSDVSNLVANLMYINRYRNPDKLRGESGYYLSSLQGAVSFVEGLDRKSLSVDDDEFEKHINEAVARIEAHKKAREEVVQRERPPPPAPINSEIYPQTSSGPQMSYEQDTQLQDSQLQKLREQDRAREIEMLTAMFPTLDAEIIEDVVRANEGRVGSSVEALLAMSAEAPQQDSASMVEKEVEKMEKLSLTDSVRSLRTPETIREVDDDDDEDYEHDTQSNRGGNNTSAEPKGKHLEIIDPSESVQSLLPDIETEEDGKKSDVVEEANEISIKSVKTVEESESSGPVDAVETGKPVHSVEEPSN